MEAEYVSIPSLAGQTARHRRRSLGHCPGAFVSIPSLAGQTARRLIENLEMEVYFYVSIPSLAGQTARLDSQNIQNIKRKIGFNPLISGADRATRAS